MATTSEEIILKIKAQFGTVDAGTNALAKLEAQIARETSSLAGLQASLSKASRGLQEMQAAASLGGGKSSSISGMLNQRALIDSLRGKIGVKKDDLGALTGALPGVKELIAANKSGGEAAAEHSVSMRKLAGAAAEGDSAFGGLIRGFAKLKAAGAAGVILALIGLVIALGAAIIVTAVALTKFALAAADVARSSRLMTDAAAGSAAAGAELDAVISDVASHSPLARDKIAEMGRSLELAHIQGRNMQNALEAATTATSAIGDAAGKAFTSIAEKSQLARRFMLSKNDFNGLSAELEGTGVAFDDVANAYAKSAGVSMATASMMIRRGQVSVKDGLEAMAAAVQQKFGKTVAAQMMSLDVQMSKLKENVGRLFSGINLEPFLKALKSVTDLFSETTYEGYALKQAFTIIFDGVFGSLSEAGPALTDFFDGVIIGVLTLYLNFLLLKRAWNDTFGDTALGQIDMVQVGMYAVLITVAGITALFIALVGTLALVGAVIYFGVIKPIMDIYDVLKGIDLSGAAKMVVMSIANGLLGGIPSVIEAMGKIGAAIRDGLPKALQMRSPSVILTRQAEMAAQSVIVPLEDAAPDAHRAMADLGGGRPDFSGAVGQRGGKSVVINVEFKGNLEDFDSFETRTRSYFESIFRGGPEPEPTS